MCTASMLTFNTQGQLDLAHQYQCQVIMLNPVVFFRDGFTAATSGLHTSNQE